MTIESGREGGLSSKRESILRDFRNALRANESPRVEDYVERLSASGEQAELRADLNELLLAHESEAEAARWGLSSDSSEPDEPGVANGDDLGDAPQRIGRYHLKQHIGGGGFGDVYLAEDEGLRRSVAIKIPKRKANKEKAEEQFLAEMQTVAKLDSRHPAIVPIFDFGKIPDGRLYVVMKYIDGRSLDRAIASGVRIVDAVRIARQVAEALHQAHLADFVHRDVKPGNVLLDQNDQPHLTDFGLALHAGQQHKHAGDASGTMPYRAPEQVLGQANWMDPRCDIWGLGVVLYEMLVGVRPFQGETQKELNDQILYREPRSLRTINDNIPLALHRICFKCLRKGAEDRFTAADELAAALGEIENTLPHSDSPPRNDQKLATVSPARRFFISYPQGDPQEEHLAKTVRDHFVADGGDCFIDVGMTAGTEWFEEINRRLRWCDYLIVLLSKNAMHSEMVQTEVRLAHLLRQQTGKPKVLPVRLRYFGPLEYEMDLYLGNLHFIRWNGPEDSENVAQLLLRASLSDYEPPPSNSTDLPATSSADQHDSDSRPKPSVNARAATVPGGTIRSSDRYYITRPEDAAVVQCAQDHGETLVIKGPRQVGKSTLLLRYLSECQREGKKVAFVDFSIFSEPELADYQTFLSRLAEIFAQRLGTQQPATARADSQASMTQALEEMLAQVDSPVAIALDEADRIFGRDYQGDFFSMLRMWHNNRAPFPEWEDVDLAMAISTEPYLLISESDRSPFNVGLVLELSPFTAEACSELNERYGRPLDASQESELYQLLAGHPYLTRLAFYRICGPVPFPFHELISTAAEDHGPFGDHLRAILFKLHQTPELLEAMRSIVRTGCVPDQDLFYRLYGAGLVRRERRRINPANLLYGRYFRDAL